MTWLVPLPVILPLAGAGVALDAVIDLHDLVDGANEI